MGSGHFDDNSSDTSTDGKPNDSNTPNQRGGDGEKSLSDAGNLNNNTDNKYEYAEDNHCDDGLSETSARKNLTTSDMEIKFTSGDNYDDDDVDDVDDDNRRELNNPKNEIPPPPGEPRPENTARLRRYRLNLE